MKTISAHIKNFFFQPVQANTLALFRIAVSTFALIQLFVLLPDWMWLYGPKGLLPWEISDALSTTQTPTFSFVANLLSSLHISQESTLYIVTVVYILSLVGLLIGFKTRLMAILAWLMHIIFNSTGHFIAYGVETFLHIALFYCTVFPVGCRWSADAQKKRQDIHPYMITLSVRVIQLHLCIMYLSCGIEKCMGTQWWNGEAIWIAMQQDQFHRVNIDWMAQFPIVAKILCWGTLLVEGLYPIGMYWKKTKKIWLISIISMHAFIGIFLGLELFGGLMILLNFSIFGSECFPGLFSTRFPKLLSFLSFSQKEKFKEVQA